MKRIIIALLVLSLMSACAPAKPTPKSYEHAVQAQQEQAPRSVPEDPGFGG